MLEFFYMDNVAEDLLLVNFTKVGCTFENNGRWKPHLRRSFIVFLWGCKLFTTIIQLNLKR